MGAILLKKIVSGGQAGVDRAALDAAAALGLQAGGWCPKGRLSEDGPIPARYPLRETSTAEYAQRTEANARDSDATLILSPLPLEGGSALTRRLAAKHKKPCLALDPRLPGAAERAKAWLAEAAPAVLNVAGPRASRWPEGYDAALALLLTLVPGTSVSE